MSDERWKESEQGCWMRRFGTFHDSACIIDGVLHVNAQAVITHIPLDVLGHMLSRAGLALVPAADVPTAEERAGLEAWPLLSEDARESALAELARRAANARRSQVERVTAVVEEAERLAKEAKDG